ncbi:MAG: hypothetical protein ACRD59_07780 [Candidatus Acidiferrales bacterium]
MISRFIVRSVAVRRVRVQRGFRVALFAFAFFASLHSGPRAQDAEATDRVYKHTKVEVEQALQALQAFATNRLPVLDGFVSANASTLTKFENPHYQFRIDVESQGAGQTLVSISAKITAWSAEADAARAQYVVVPSNGRLEQDMLDRLSVFLEKGNAGRSDESSAHGMGSSEASARPAPASTASAGSSSGSPRLNGSPAPAARAATATPSPKTLPRVNTADPAALAGEIASVQAQRQSSELNQRKLQQQISELEANASTQKYLSNLAVIKSPQTAVFQQDDDTSKVLFRADPEDEFEVIAAKDTWAHVRLENGADGWLRSSQLQPTQEVDDAEDAAAALNFTTPNQEIKPFAGDWAPLKRKLALFVFAQPSRAIPDAILGQSQFQFAKHIFTEGYREATHSEQSMSGVVVVFLGNKGGVAAATLADIRRWRDGAISDKVFLERCSLDPPESFRDAPVGATARNH